VFRGLDDAARDFFLGACVFVGIAPSYPPTALSTPTLHCFVVSRAWVQRVAKHPSGRSKGVIMLVLGIVLMLIGFLLAIPVLWTIGIILAIVGAVLWVAEGAGATWGRRWY